MPGDTPSINTKARQQNSYDAIVAGSGISGGWAAKELCEKGLKVLLLDRGRQVAHGDYPSLTYRVLTARACNYAVKESKKMTI